MALERELKTYEAQKRNLLATKGKYVVIFGDRIIGVFAAYEDALKAGYAQAKDEPFLAKKIEETESVLFFSRKLAACPN